LIDCAENKVSYKKAWLGVIGVVLLTLTGCQVTHNYQRLHLPLMSPADWSQNLQVTQIVTISSHKKRLKAMTALLLTPDKITMAILSTIGQRLVAVEYDGTNLDITYGETIEPLPVRQILSLIQLALWPKQILRMAYQNELELVVTRELRQVFFEESLAVEVTLSDWQLDWPNVIHITNHMSAMEIDVITVDLQRL